MITPVTDHAARAQARLPDHLQDASNLLTLLSILVSPFQEIEDLHIALLNERGLAAAVGAQLDLAGTIMDVERAVGQSDAAYRIALQGAAAELQKSGEPEALIEAYLAMQAATLVYLTEHQAFTVELHAAVTTDPDDPALDAATVAAMRKVKGGAVGMILAVGPAPLFLWGDEADADASGDLPVSIHGFGDETDADASGDLDPGEGGGNFSRLIT